MRKAIAIAGLSLLLAKGCASEPEREFSEQPVGNGSSTTEEKPWKEGPVDSESDRRERGRQTDEGKADRMGNDARSRELGEVFPNKTIQLDFTNADVRRVFRVFREEARVNLVLGPDVEGRVTISTSEVQLADAFRAVVGAADLEWERTAGAILLKPAD